MMKYFVSLFVVYKDGTKDKVGIYTYETQEEALRNFYKYMSDYVGTSNVASVTAEAKNSVGGVYKNEGWVAPADEPIEGV